MMGWATTVAVVAGVVTAGLLAVDDADEHDSEASESACVLTVDDQPRPRWVGLSGTGPIDLRVEGAATGVAGRTATASNGRAVFRPAVRLAPGLRYTVSRGACTATLEVPRVAAAAPEVAAIYPRTETLPANVLRFYIYFTEPMADGRFLDHVRLEHVQSGRDLTGVFFDNIYELWSRDRRRITLLVDPGRVKTGLIANQKMGRAFVAGQTYRLHVDPTWQSLAGVPLRSGLSATWRAVAEDKRPVDVQAWRVTSLERAGVSSLRVDFGEAVDHVSVHRLLSVVGPNGERVRGAWSLEPGDLQARWVPATPWLGPLDRYRLRAEARFEDIAGNSVAAAFEHGVGDVPRGGEERPRFRSIEPAGPTGF